MTLWALCAVGLVGAGWGRADAATATVESSLVERAYRVYGKSASAVVSYMKRRPFRGDYGPAMANIRPRYDLRVETRRRGGHCAVRALRLRVRFVMTLPRAVDRRAFDRSTRRSWDAFRAFTRRHELRHRRIYLRCLRRFVRDARRIRGASCMRLDWAVRRALRAADKRCDRHHHAFDRRDFRRLPHMALFVKARADRRGRAAVLRRAAWRGGRSARRREWARPRPVSGRLPPRERSAAIGRRHTR